MICKAGLCGLNPCQKVSQASGCSMRMHAKVMGFVFPTMKLSSLTSSVHTAVGTLTAKTGPDTAVQSCMHLPHMFNAGLNGAI